MRSSSGDRLAFTREGGVGVPCRISWKMTAELSPRKGAVPVDISYNTAPKENKRLRAPRSLARARAGDIYATVPSKLPGLVGWLGSISRVARVSASESAGLAEVTLARPKSRILARPRLVTKIFCGLISR